MRIKYFISGLLFFFAFQSYAVDYYWVGGSGNWSDINHWATSSGGTLNHIQTPTANDNVIFDANSMAADASINLNLSTIICKDFDVQQITYNLQFVGGSIWKIYGGYRLSPKFNSNNILSLYFEALNGVHFIKTAGNYIGSSIYFKGNATWSLSDSIYCNKIYLESGTLNTNSQSVICSGFQSNSSNIRLLVLGNSIVFVKKWNVNGVGYSVNGGSSIINLTGTYFQHSVGQQLAYNDLIFLDVASLSNQGQTITFRKVWLKRKGNISGDYIYDSLIFTKPYRYNISQGSTQTIMLDFVALGDCKRKITVVSQNLGAIFTKASGTIICTYLILHNIHASGGASFYATGSDDQGGNVGWIMTPAPSRTLYWIGGYGEWTDTLHWSSSSGGVGGECFPTTVDDVIIDQNSFPVSAYPDEIILDSISDCHDFYWHNQVDADIVQTNILNISGSVFFGDLMNFSNRGFLSFVSNDLGETIQTNNIHLNSQFIVFIGDGSWTLLDDLNNDTGQVFLNRGHLLTGGNYIHTDDFNVGGKDPKKLSLFNSTIDVLSRLFIQQDSSIIFPGTSHFRIKGPDGAFKSLGLNADTLYNMSFLSENASAKFDSEYTRFNKVRMLCDMHLTGNAESDTLYFEKGNSYVFTGRFDTINKALIANGTCMDIITMREATAMGEFNFYMPSSANVNTSFLSLRGCVGQGGAAFTTNSSSDLGRNIGWAFTNSSQDHFWIGGTGNWQDSSHWSYSSGGVGGACIPTINDDVYFDANSFSSSGGSVIIDTADFFCKDMDWTGAVGNPLFINGSNYAHFISGSFTAIPSMVYNNLGQTYFVGNQQNKTIKSSNQLFVGFVSFCDVGQWTLLDTMQVIFSMYHHSGHLIANQNAIITGSYFGDYNDPKILDIQQSKVVITTGGVFKWLNNNQTTLLAHKSTIDFNEGSFLETTGSGQAQFYDVNFLGEYSGEIKHLTSLTNRFNKLYFSKSGTIKGDNYIDTLIFSRGSTYAIENGTNQYITNKWKADGDCYAFIKVEGTSFGTVGGSQAHMHLQNGNVLINGVKLANINGVGTGSFMDVNGIDLGGNSSNWQISPMANRTLYWVNNSGDWFDTTHWSLSSGGLGGECIPTKIDNVIYDSLSFHLNLDTVITFKVPECHDLIWKWTPSEPYMNIYEMEIYGSLYLGDTMTIRFDAQMYMKAADTGNYIRTKQHHFNLLKLITQGEWSLLDDMDVDEIIQEKGSLITMGNSVNVTDFYTNPLYNASRKLNIDGSDLFIKNSMALITDSLLFSATNSHIQFDSSVSIPNFELRMSGSHVIHFDKVSFIPPMVGKTLISNTHKSIHTYNKMTINNSATILGEHIFDSLIFHFNNTYKLDEGKTQEVMDYWFVRGNNCYAINLQSTVKNNSTYVKMVNGSVSGDFINMRDIHALGGASFFAGNFSTDISNNSGWSFSNGPQYVYGLGPDVKFNLGGSVTLSTVNFNGGPKTTYLWSTGSTNSTITVNQTGWYYVTVNYADDCIVYDSLFVGCNLTMNYNVINNPCFGDSLGQIHALVPDPNYTYNYFWSNGDTLNMADSLFAGAYTVLVSADSGLCVVFDTIQINEPPEIFCPQGDTAFCTGDSVMLDLGSFKDYFWSDNYQGQYRWVAVPDTFIVSVEDQDGCKSMPDSISIRKDLHPIVDLGPDSTICLGDWVRLDAGSDRDKYLWSNNSAMSAIDVQYIGVYWVVVHEKTCVESDTIELFNCPPKFIVPNVFTPNGDGYNDVFNIDYQNIWEFDVRIYNRWGGRVFISSNLENFWDGKINGVEAADGVYFWEIIYKEYNGSGGGYEDKSVRGTVTLLRN